MTIASTPTPSRIPRYTTRRKEVITMMQKLHALLFPSRRRAPRDMTPFNGALLDHNRDAVFLALRQIHLLR